LWYATRGQLIPLIDLVLTPVDIPMVPSLDLPLPIETIEASRKAFYEIVEESQLSEEAFGKLVIFFVSQFFYTICPGGPGMDSIRLAIYDTFTEPAIKITRRIIDSFKVLCSQNHHEEVYQQFLTKHPVFIDPLATEVIPKQKLGLEHVTDFVVRRLDNEYILVEIEKPQDTIFTVSNDFSARFTHAYGQVLDFQEWVDTHGEYARSIMPGIFSPKGVLLMGMRKDLTVEQMAKLKRFSINSRSIEVFTFDDLIRKAEDLYQNIHLR
jgi:hypothetical protein